VLLGTTDTSITAINEEPQALDEEIMFLLETAGEYLRKQPTREDCLSVFVGIRPLVQTQPGAKTSTLSRDHTLEVSSTGLLTLTGGKWTTYRQMAEDCIDRVLQLLGEPHRPSVTRDLRLHGCPQDQVVSSSSIGAVYGCDADLLEQLIRQTPSLGERLHADLPIRGAEVVWAVRHEWARTIEDVLARRTRALFLNARASLEMAPAVGQLMASELNRDENWQAAQRAAFRRTASLYTLG
jgi:glycerol-3-phosphate dehydrogenase